MKKTRIFKTNSPLSREWYLDPDTFTEGHYDVSRYLLMHDLDIAKDAGSLSREVEYEIVKNNQRLRVTVVNEADWLEVENQINRIFDQAKGRITSNAAMKIRIPAREYLERTGKI